MPVVTDEGKDDDEEEDEDVAVVIKSDYGVNEEVQYSYITGFKSRT